MTFKFTAEELKHMTTEQVSVIFRETFADIVNKHDVDDLTTFYLRASKELVLNRPNSVWLSFWGNSEEVCTGYSKPIEINDQHAIVANLTQIFTALSAFPIQYGQISHLLTKEDQTFVVIWSIIPQIAFADFWRVERSEDDKVEFVQDGFNIRKDETLTNKTTIVGTYMSTLSNSVLMADEDKVIYGDNPRIFAEWLNEQGHDFTFSYDSIIS